MAPNSLGGIGNVDVVGSQSKVKPHKSAHRHKTGMTKKATELLKKRKDALHITPKDLMEHEVEAILDHKRFKNKLYYQVKWVAPVDPTWEPISSFVSKECIQEYWNKQSHLDAKKIPREFRASRPVNSSALVTCVAIRIGATTWT
jgi:hypothetical protein